MNQIDKTTRGVHSGTSSASGTAASAPLVVALEGALVTNPIADEARWARRAAQVADLARRIDGEAPLGQEGATLRPEGLAYSQRVLDLIADARADATPVYLAAGQHHALGLGIAEHLGIFDGVWTEEDAEGREGHVYLGADADAPLWRNASHVVTVHAGAGVRAAADAHPGGATNLGAPTGLLIPTLRAMRPHQWLKNLLVVLPAVAAHQFDAQTLLVAALAFAAFSLVASSVYLLNDLLDLRVDRMHPRKCKRPFAAGDIPIAHGTGMAAGLLGAGVILSLLLGGAFFVAMLVYYAVTLAYSMNLKKRAIVDICVLAFLYTMRIIAGGVATGIELSVWLLAFSIFFFFSMAAVKRQAELVDMAERGKLDASGRGYSVKDLDIISMMAIGAGYMSILVMALYVNSPAVVGLYSMPAALWGICFILLYWISRMAIITHRGHMNDDPVLFAAKDRNSQLCAVTILALAVIGAVI